MPTQHLESYTLGKTLLIYIRLGSTKKLVQAIGITKEQKQRRGVGEVNANTVLFLMILKVTYPVQLVWICLAQEICHILYMNC